MDFKDQYKHPSWQKKRLEALNAAEFICQRCYDTESQLHVHHKRYVKGRMIWEYQISELEVLCDSCHEEAHYEKEVLGDLLARFPSEAIGEFISLISGYSSLVNGPAGTASVDDVLLTSRNPMSVDAGTLAAIAQNRLPLWAIIDLYRAVENTKSGGSFTFLIPIKERFNPEAM